MLGGTTNAAAFKNSKMPKAVICYLCGKNFGTTSITIHLKSCQEKWVLEESKKPQKDRRKVPAMPHELEKSYQSILSNPHATSSQYEEFNNMAFNFYNKKSLVPCPGCHRTFLPQSLEVHLKSCKTGQAASETSSKGPSMAHRPRAVFCYICGKEYGTASIQIHIKACKKKFLEVESQKPKSERRPLPSTPKNFSLDSMKVGGGGIKSSQLEELNEEAYQKFKDEALVECPNCARKFLPDSLKVHLRSCGKGHFKNPVPLKGKLPEANKTSQPQFEEEKKTPLKKMGITMKPKAAICYICGREYGTASIEIHLKTCAKKWEEQESKKPPNERKPLPQKPKTLDNISESGGKITGKQLDAYNNQAFEDFKENVLEECINCGRKFLPDRLVVHLKSCKVPVENKFKKMREESKMMKTASNNFNNSSSISGNNKPSEFDNTPIKSKQVDIKEFDEGQVKLEPCPICSRKFKSDRLQVHQKICEKNANKSEKKPNENNEDKLTMDSAIKN